jgi:F-type H+-transporting ATPase subunit b
MFHEPSFWVTASFVLLIITLYKPVGRILGEGLDGRANRVQGELDEALRLKEEAQALLASYQRKQKEALEEAEAIVAHAEAEAKRIRSSSEAELEGAINKRVDMAMQKIATYEAAILQEIRYNAVDVTGSTVRSLVQEKIGAKDAEQLVAESIQEIGKKLN